MTGGMLGAEYKFPAFDELPKIEGMPQGSIWGFYDKNGKKDEVGCMLSLIPAALEYLTNTVQLSICLLLPSSKLRPKKSAPVNTFNSTGLFTTCNFLASVAKNFTRRKSTFPTSQTGKPWTTKCT